MEQKLSPIEVLCLLIYNEINDSLRNQIEKLNKINSDLQKNTGNNNALNKEKKELLLYIYLNYKTIHEKISKILLKYKHNNEHDDGYTILKMLDNINSLVNPIIEECIKNNIETIYEERKNEKNKSNIAVKLENDILELKALLKVYFQKKKFLKDDHFLTIRDKIEKKIKEEAYLEELKKNEESEKDIDLKKWKEAKIDLIDFLSNKKFKKEALKVKDEIDSVTFFPLVNIVTVLFSAEEQKNIKIFENLAKNTELGLQQIEGKIRSTLSKEETQKGIYAFYRSVAFSQFDNQNKDHFLSGLIDPEKLRQKNIKDNPLAIDIANSIVTNNEYNEALISLLKETTCTAEDFKEEKKYNSLNYLKYTLMDKVLTLDKIEKGYIDLLSDKLKLFTPEVLEKLKLEITKKIEFKKILKIKNIDEDTLYYRIRQLINMINSEKKFYNLAMQNIKNIYEGRQSAGRDGTLVMDFLTDWIDIYKQDINNIPNNYRGEIEKIIKFTIENDEFKETIQRYIQNRNNPIAQNREPSLWERIKSFCGCCNVNLNNVNNGQLPGPGGNR